MKQPRFLKCIIDFGNKKEEIEIEVEIDVKTQLRSRGFVIRVHAIVAGHGLGIGAIELNFSIL